MGEGHDPNHDHDHDHGHGHGHNRERDSACHPAPTFASALLAGLLGERPQGMATSPSGYYLCTVLVDEASGRSIVVNRGWMPADVAERREWAKEDGVVEVVGVVGQGETPATFSPPNNPSSGTMLWFELPVLLQVSSNT